jgi:hypothetical protein
MLGMSTSVGARAAASNRDSHELARAVSEFERDPAAPRAKIETATQPLR